MVKRYVRHIALILTLLLLGGMVNEAWADVTYIILTKPFNVKKADGTEWYRENVRLEALRYTSPGTTVYLPDAFRSPLAKNFRYWRTPTVTLNTKFYDDTGTSPKVLQTRYDIYTAVADPLIENDPVPDGVTTIYVTYDYDEDNTILKLDGAHKYNIALGSGNSMRYLCFNKNRNNRPAAALATTVSAEDLISDDFVSNVNGFDGTKSVHYQFYLCGEDPYNITIMTAYEGNLTYNEEIGVEKDQDKKYKKPFKGSTIFAKLQSNNNNDGTANMWLAPDAHRHYKSKTNENEYDSWEGFYRSDMDPIFNAVAVLPKGTGYFFVASKLNQNGKIYQPNASGYYATLTADGKNPRMIFKAIDVAIPMEPDPITTYTFNVKTSFGNTISATSEWSDAYKDTEITTSHMPESLKRKYCSYVGFYKDAALSQKITKFSDVPAEGNIYVKYEVSGAPFTAISPSAGYTTATWYELTDAGSTQASGKKLKWDSENTVFKNNGANAVYDKLSEFAFVGDPYELRVLYRDATETAKAKRYVSGATNLGVSASDYTTSSTDFTYGTSYTYNTENLSSGKKTLTFKISGLTGGKKIKVTKGGTDGEAQVDSSTPTLNTVTDEKSTTETITVTLNANAGVAKTMTITIQEYDTDGETTIGTSTVVTINQVVEAWSWDIPDDNTDGSFELRQFGTDSKSTTKRYWQWTTGSSGNNITINTSSTRMKVMELPKFTYTYNVVDLAGNIAIKAAVVQPIFTPISGYASIPADIRSPFLADETVTYYSSYSDINGDGKTDRRDWHYAYSEEVYTLSEQPTLTETPATGNADIYVSYTTLNLTSKTIQLKYTEEFNVKLNGEYIYWDSETNKILSKSLAANADELATSAYLWHLRGRDPYSMRIDNKGYSENQFTNPSDPGTTGYFYNPVGDGTYTNGGSPETIANGMFVRVKDGTWGNDKELEFVNNRGNASRFVAMMGGYAGVYEVLAATGTTALYHIGRVSTAEAETKIYSTDTEHGGYAHGADQLRFELAGRTVITYTLIDKAKNELFTVTSTNPRLALPSEYQSPLVDTYYYYPTKAKALTDNHTNNINEITNDTKEDNTTPGDDHVWVTYTVNDHVKFNTASNTKNNPYLLRFHNGKSYRLEDGNDKLTSYTDESSKIKAMYPYCNGDGNLNIYGQAMRDEQMNGGTSTRSRWQWFFESANSDPYHVKIHSNNQITTPLGKDYTYFMTKAVHFNRASAGTYAVVTGATLPGVSDPATEYMILGTTGKYRLVTTYKVDCNNDGDINDDVDVRHTVTSFEQYWKTYNMVKQCVLGFDVNDDENYKDFFSENPEDYIMPSGLWSALKTKLGSGSGNLDINDSGDLNYVDGCSWHSYTAVANAVRWNGYNTATTKSKVVEKLEHWFQTFDMGDGTFEIEEGFIPPVLVLLDRHGWEIMRKPIPMGSSDVEAEAKLEALKAFDSPMVKEYKFSKAATKASGCHKYTLKSSDDIGFTSTSLGKLPPYVSGRDLFVTYTVKEEYARSYQPDLKKASKFIVLQNHQFASDDGSGTSIDVTTMPSPLSDEIIADAGKEEASKTFNQGCLWYVQPYSDIDTEMGYPSTNDTPSYTDDDNGFDPYNVQLKNVSTSKFFTIDMKKSILSGGVYTGDYDGGSLNVTLATANDSPIESEESYDHSTLKMTNQTFMAVKDVNGNMQLMPRFDHSHRINAFATLADPSTHVAAEVDDVSPGEQTTFMVRPQVFNYKVIDNLGEVALCYQTGGEFYPSMPEHFKSPLATGFKFYFGNAVYTTAESTAEAWEAAVGSYKKTATSSGDMNGQIRDITAIGDYYFKVGSDTYTYTKVTVTNANTTSSSNGIYDDVKEGRDISGREITSSFAEAGVQTDADIFIRYDYNDTYDTDHQNILQGQWLTMSLGENDVQATGTLSTADGTGVCLYTGTKNAAEHKWQWKFLQSPMAPSSELYVAPDPYRVIISNREANYEADPTASSPSKMATAIKISDKDRFVILSHPSGDYALCAAGDGLTYSFLNGGSMTAPDAGSPVAASVESEGSFTKTTNTISAGARIIFTEDVPHTYTYYIINNSSKLAASDTQDNATALSNEFKPVVPYNIQSPLINNDDYKFYATAKINDNSTPADPSDDTYTIDSDVERFIIDNLYGLFDDVVYVRYPAFSRDNTPYMVPNARNATSPAPASVEVGSGSNEVAIDINGQLPYNIIWLSDNMMTSDGSIISDGGCHELSGLTADKWHFTGSDPYAIKIKHDSGDKYVEGTSSLVAAGFAKSYMFLKREGYDYGVLAETGNQSTMLTFSGSPATLTTTKSSPVKFIPFALSVHNLIYHLVIAKSCANHASPNTGEYIDIPYRTGDEDMYQTSGTWTDQVRRIYGSTQRDLTSTTTVTGDIYQLGETIYFQGETTTGMTYCYDAGKVSLGDVLEVPSALKRPNCRYYYYVQDIYDNYNEEYDASTGASTGGIDKRCETLNMTLNNKYKGLKMDDETPKLMSKSDLIGKTVVINVTYSFDTGLPTNAGDGFVTDVNQNLWYTFETNEATPYLAHYTNAWGLQAMAGRDTRYTNDYLWLPLGDPYGFKMYNRYIKKNSSTDGDDDTRMMTTDNATFSSEDVTGHENLKMLKPVESDPNPANNETLKGNEVYELLASNTAGYFRVHPVINNSGTQYFIRKDPSDNYAKLSTTATEWTFGLTSDLIMPYVDRIDYVGGLKSDVANSTAFEITGEPGTVNVKDIISAIKNGTADAEQLMKAQKIVYNTDNIVGFSSGYYRLHNQPGVSSISQVRYASGYLHDIEKTQEAGFFQKTATDASDVVSKSNTLRNIGDYYFNVNNGESYEKVTVTVAYDGATNATHNATSHVSSTESEWLAAGGMPMHFYSKVGVTGTFTGETNPLGSGNFTESNATRGEIPIPATEFDPSSIFYIDGSVSTNKTISAATLSTQGLKVNQNRMTTGAAQTFTMMDLGGATFLIHDGSAPPTRMYLNFDQTANKYDLKYYHESPTDDVKWCLEPVNKQGLMIETHSGGDGYYYSTFCAPYDVTLPADDGGKTYNAYVCTEWHEQAIHPTSIGKTITAGTPAIIRTKDTSGSVKVTLPGTASSATSCVFTGKYLEQLLATPITAGDKVFTFGLPITGYNLTIEAAGGFTNGEVNNVVEGSDPAYTSVGFYLNATKNKEKSDRSGEWTLNNRYVLHNKIYYRSGSSGASAPQLEGVQFVPVIFGDEEPGEEELQPDGSVQVIGDGCIYDLLGRKVATRE